MPVCSRSCLGGRRYIAEDLTGGQIDGRLELDENRLANKMPYSKRAADKTAIVAVSAFQAVFRIPGRITITENKKGETGTFSTSRVEERRYAILVKNLHTRAIQVQVIDRIPVSMQQDITVEFSASKGAGPSEKDVNGKRGTLMWQMRAAPGEEKQIAFGYRVTAPANNTIPHNY